MRQCCFAGGIHLLRMDDGTTIKTQPEGFAHAACMDASDDMLFVGASESMARITLPGLDPVSEEKTPVAFNALAVERRTDTGCFIEWQRGLGIERRAVEKTASCGRRV